MVINKSQQVLLLLLEACWDLFFPYLSQQDIGKLDTALTDKSLRKMYFTRLNKFCDTYSIDSPIELEWVMKRGIDLTICYLDFDCKGMVYFV